MNFPGSLPIEPTHVGSPNIGSQEEFLARVEQVLKNRWLTNNGKFVQEFEAEISKLLGVKHCIAVCNATIGMEVAIRALDLTGEVIVPSYTFIATAHALSWLGIRPVFADINPNTHNIDWESVERLITPNTSAIFGVHLWGRACNTTHLEELAEKYGLKLLFDAAHAFFCSKNQIMIGNFGECEVFSFHATKFVNSLEGGAITTNNDQLAEKIRFMINFGFAGYDSVGCLGTNAKMNEISAAMGLTNLNSVEKFVNINQRNYKLYKKIIDKIPGLSVMTYDESEQNNYHYIVVEVDSCPNAVAIRDLLVQTLHDNRILARKYFWPGCHRMEPYISCDPYACVHLHHTEHLAGRVLVLPNGESVDEDKILGICAILERTIEMIAD